MKRTPPPTLNMIRKGMDSRMVDKKICDEAFFAGIDSSNSHAPSPTIQCGLSVDNSVRICACIAMPHDAERSSWLAEFECNEQKLHSAY